MIRLAYRTSAARWRAGYQIAAVDDATTAIALTARYTVELGGLRGPGGEAAPADVVLRALPAADDAAAIVVWRGPVALGDATITVVGPATTRPARVRRWYRGAAVTEGSDPRARGWGQGSRAEVWRELVFARAAEDVPGELRVAIADGQGGRRWLTGALALAPLGGRAVVRVPLDVDPSLVGFRARLIHDDGEGLADEVRLSVANRGAAPVRVILEEPLRPIGRAAVRFAAPAPGTLSAAVWQLEVEVAPGGLERAAVLLQYPALP